MSWSNLQTLNLGKNKIRDEGAKELGKNKTWNNLQELILSSNSIFYGASEFSKYVSWTNLFKLNLGDNYINWEGNCIFKLEYNLG